MCAPYITGKINEKRHSLTPLALAMALEDAWLILKNSAAPAWTRNIPEESKEDLAEREREVAYRAYPRETVDEVTGDIFAPAGDAKDHRIQTNEALTNMRQGTHVDLRQGQLDQANKILDNRRAAWRKRYPPRSFAGRVWDRLTGQNDRITEEESTAGQLHDVDWRTRQLQAARRGEELSGRHGGFRSIHDETPPTQPFAAMNHQIQRMPAPGVGAESSFNTNPPDATTHAFAPAPTWQGQELPKQQQSWVPPTQ